MSNFSIRRIPRISKKYLNTNPDQIAWAAVIQTDEYARASQKTFCVALRGQHDSLQDGIPETLSRNAWRQNWPAEWTRKASKDKDDWVAKTILWGCCKTKNKVYEDSKCVRVCMFDPCDNQHRDQKKITNGDNASYKAKIAWDVAWNIIDGC